MIAQKERKMREKNDRMTDDFDDCNTSHGHQYARAIAETLLAITKIPILGTI